MAHPFKIGAKVKYNGRTLAQGATYGIQDGEILTVLGYHQAGNLQTHQDQIDENHGWLDISGFTLVSEPTTLDFTQPIQTRDGRPVTIISTEGRGTYSIVGYVSNEENVTTWTPDGCYHKQEELSKNDIFNVPAQPKQIIMWFNVYETCTVGHSSKELADNNASNERIACKRVVFTEGEFDHE